MSLATGGVFAAQKGEKPDVFDLRATVTEDVILLGQQVEDWQLIIQFVVRCTIKLEQDEEF
jgi:hypothetical protein